MTDMTPEEEAVIKAAEAYEHHCERGDHLCAQAGVDLKVAVQALRASREPVGKRPEEVAPCRFIFPGDSVANPCMLFHGPNSVRMWSPTGESCAAVFSFDADATIIPIEEEAAQECEPTVDDLREAMEASYRIQSERDKCEHEFRPDYHTFGASTAVSSRCVKCGATR